MSIVTKFGDKGQTTGPNGRIEKSDQFITTVGTLDELQAHIGLIFELCNKEHINIDTDLLDLIMGDIYQLQGDLYLNRFSNIANFSTVFIEAEIDRMEGEMPKLNYFIKPIGSVLAAEIHIARTVCRRAERELVKYYQEIEKIDVGYEFINRLSDYLFTLARYVYLAT